MNLEKVTEHYEHAKAKHPHFCDMLFPHEAEGRRIVAKTLKMLLDESRAHLKKATENKKCFVKGYDVLFCEILEAEYAYYAESKKRTIEELYDCIAVLLRMVDYVEAEIEQGKKQRKRGKKNA